MQKKEIADLLVSFDEQSDKVKTCLADLLDVVKSGRVPTQEAMTGLDCCVVDLRIRYNAVYAAARDSLAAEELPACGVPASDIVDAVINSQKKYLSEQLNRAAAILKKFISVKSLIDGYAAALAPYQTEAALILEQMAEDTVEALLPETESSEIFLEAMQEKNIHNMTGIELMTRVQQKFPDMAITMGLLTGQYFFADEDGTSDAILEPDMPGNDSEERSVVLVTEDVVAENAFIVEDGKNADTCPIKNMVKTGSASVSTFKKEIDKLSRSYPEVRVILPLFTNLGVLDEYQIYIMISFIHGFGENEDRICAAVDMLVEKGYLAEFTVDQTTLYCLPKYVSACMQKESIKKSKDIFKLSVGRVTLSANTEISVADACRFYFCNETLTQYLHAQHATLPAPRYAKIKESIRWCDGFYKVAFYDGDTLCTAHLCSLPYLDGKTDGAELNASDIEAK